MLEAILPASVSVAASRGDIAGAEPLLEEEAAVARAVASRRREFATARACARRALEPLGLSGEAIPAGPGGAPRWPAGVVGSITHCDGYRACAVARGADFAAIGVDAEPDAPLPAGLLADIALPEERAWVWELTRRVPLAHWDRLLFCAKEAVYKAWQPLTGRRLGFEDAVVSVDPTAGTLRARLVDPGRTSGDVAVELSGRWLARDGLVMAAIALPATAAVGHPVRGAAACSEVAA